MMKTKIVDSILEHVTGGRGKQSGRPASKRELRMLYEYLDNEPSGPEPIIIKEIRALFELEKLP